MTNASGPPLLPLVLWDTPPGLEQMLGQEGTPSVSMTGSEPSWPVAGRFVIGPRSRLRSSAARAMATAGHDLIAVEALAGDERPDPFRAVLDSQARPHGWHVSGTNLVERVSRVDRAAVRGRVIGRLRERVRRAGGLWARLSAYPYPYRAAFGFRVDLDESEPEDYARFARYRRPLDGCTTHFVCTSAYAHLSAVMSDLAGRDAQSHAHRHVITRDRATNRRNLLRADELLRNAGFAPEGFAAPEGRWNAGLDRVLEELGYLYSSDFQLGRDDVPFYPWNGSRFSRVLQVPIHPVCEGLFLGAGIDDPGVIGGYLAEVVRRRLASGQPAFVYGHPERRLGRLPGVLDAVARASEEAGSLVWKVTMTEFARWWRWRDARRWSLVAKGAGVLEAQFESTESRYRLGLELFSGDHVALVPLSGPSPRIALDGLLYERRRAVDRRDGPHPHPVRGSWSLRWALRHALDYETVTPLDELAGASASMRLKRGLRRLRSRTHEGEGPV
jgi:peptidoglycan/xylan/chitin deacetylase (PgdA/CDA1 family)